MKDDISVVAQGGASSSSSEIAPFCALVRPLRGGACLALIRQVVSHPRIYTFGELLAEPAVQSLSSGDEGAAAHLRTLELFAYGTCEDYFANANDYIELNDAQLTKLRQLSLVSAASASFDPISYDALRAGLRLPDDRALEALIIESIYKGLVSGRMNQRLRQFRASDFAARDVRPSEVPEMINTLDAWRNVATSLQLAVTENSKVIERALQASLDEQVSLSIAIEAAQLQEASSAKSSSSNVGMFSSALGSLGLGAFAGGARSRATEYGPAAARRGVSKRPRGDALMYGGFAHNFEG